MRANPPYINQRFGRLVVTTIEGRRSNVRCDCGTEKSVRSKNLQSGVTRSCGCLQKEISRNNLVTGRRSHGKSKTPEYNAFIHAQDRCRNPTHRMYQYYGGRGIEFRFNDFEEFLGELGERPSNAHSLDRMNNDGHYEKGNVRWATKEQQMKNRRGWAKTPP